MKVGSKFAVYELTPSYPAQVTTANRAIPTAPHTGTAGLGTRATRRSRTSCSRGVDHSADRATNETTSTIAAAHANSHAGTGRLARPEIPCAAAGSASRISPSSSAADRAPHVRTRDGTKGLLGSATSDAAPPVDRRRG